MYVCNGCGKTIGLIADAKGVPTLYMCPKYQTVEGPQVIERRVFPKQKRRKKNAVVKEDSE